MASILSSQGVALATAVAVSGATVILLAIRLQKSPSTTPHSPLLSLLLPPPARGGVISSDEEEKKEKKKKKKKRVHFAEDVVDPSGNSDEYRKLHSNKYLNHQSPLKKGGTKVQEMPANRMALYNGILRDRVLHKVAYSC